MCVHVIKGVNFFRTSACTFGFVKMEKLELAINLRIIYHFVQLREKECLVSVTCICGGRWIYPVLLPENPITMANRTGWIKRFQWISFRVGGDTDIMVKVKNLKKREMTSRNKGCEKFMHTKYIAKQTKVGYITV